MTDRKLTLDALELIKRFKLGRGGHKDLYYSAPSNDPKDLLDIDNKVCIMEMVGVLQGVGVDTHVPCVSGSIGSLMISLNDDLPQGEQEKLIELVPYILHTKPIKAEGVDKEAWIKTRKEYLNVERRRDRIAEKVQCLMANSYRYHSSEGRTSFAPSSETWEKIINFIKQAADLKRWEEVK